MQQNPNWLWAAKHLQQYISFPLLLLWAGDWSKLCPSVGGSSPLTLRALGKSAKSLGSRISGKVARLRPWLRDASLKEGTECRFVAEEGLAARIGPRTRKRLDHVGSILAKFLPLLTDICQLMAYIPSTC